MQDKEMRTEMVLLSVPAEALKAAKLSPGMALEVFAKDDRLIIQKPQTNSIYDDFNEDCEGCPFCCPECGECLKAQMEEFYGEDGGDE